MLCGLACHAWLLRYDGVADTPGQPPLGVAYGVPTVVDDSLAREGDLYFEAGDREDLVHMTAAEFQGLVADSRHGAFSEVATVA